MGDLAGEGFLSFPLQLDSNLLNDVVPMWSRGPWGALHCQSPCPLAREPPLTFRSRTELPAQGTGRGSEQRPRPRRGVGWSWCWRMGVNKAWATPTNPGRGASPWRAFLPLVSAPLPPGPAEGEDGRGLQRDRDERRGECCSSSRDGWGGVLPGRPAVSHTHLPRAPSRLQSHEVTSEAEANPLLHLATRTIPARGRGSLGI